MDRRLAVPLLVAAAACVVSRNVHVESLERPTTAEPVAVTSPVKAHLIDGSTVMFRRGAQVGHDSIWGAGIRYGLALRDSASISRVPMDSIIGMEAFETRVDGARTLIYSGLLTIAGIGAGVAIACALDPKCFGSCPTFYADSAGTAVLEAEGFSYSIAPLFEARDVDRLRAPAETSGVVRLEVRNEAFETHYINHLELLEVRHGTAEIAVPDEFNRPFVVAEMGRLASATDRAGRDIGRTLGERDGDAYRTDEGVLRQAHAGDLDDWVDLVARVAADADSIALVLRLRNSLLNTILFYDIMLGDPGARSLDWVARELEQVGPAVALARWYQQHMGMKIEVRDGSGWRPVAHLKDTGPVAWKDVGIVVPVLERGSVRIRLRFPADNWRIDRVAVAQRVRRLPGGPLVHPVAWVRDAAGQVDTTAVASIVAADQRYLEVSAGQYFTAEFRPGRSVATRTFFLGSQGYYTEWVRNGWLRAPRTRQTFVPSDGALADAIARWRITQDTLEARFMATRVPVR